MSDEQSLHKIAQRCLVGTLMYKGEQTEATEVFELIQPEHFNDPKLELILIAMINITRKSSSITPVSVAEELQRTGHLKEAGNIAELYALYTEGEKYSLEAPTHFYANIVRDSSAKTNVINVLENYKGNFKDDSGISTVDAISELQSSLNKELIGLSDESTVSTVKANASKYEELILERKRISDENKEHADGLQGIPSLLPTLNKYTHGWAPSQLITCGAQTGVGKALHIHTPILTSQGWSTMGEISVGDQVYGRDGKLTNVTNVTDIQHHRKVFKIDFTNNERIYADADHLWLTQDRNNDFETVVNTQQIFDTLYHTLDNGTTVPNHSIKSSQSLKNDPMDFLVEPYDFAQALVKGSAAIDELLDGYSSVDVYTMVNDYILGSQEQRLDFVNGLDVTSDDDVTKELYFSDHIIAENVRAILSSLGYTTFFTYDDESFAYRITYYTDDDLPGNTEHRIFIVNVQEVETVPVKCIEVDNDEHVYLAGYSLIPTHNSVFAVNNAVAAARAGKSVMFFTLEMSNEEIDDRIIASMSGVSMSKLKEGNLDENDLERVRQALADLKDMKILVDSDPRVTTDAIRARAFRQAQSPDGLDLIIVDYLQLISPVGKFTNRQEAVADISRNMKLTAKTLGVPIIVLVQLNRSKSDDDEEKLPSLEDIRESAAIAMDSDVVVILHRETNHDGTTPHTLVILDKNRNGESKKIIRCHSNLECSVFREVKLEKDVTEERLSAEDLEELEADIDLDDFDDFDADDLDLDL